MDSKTLYNVASCLVACCILACVLAFAAICIAFPRKGAVDFDYMGIIVGILSLLVTVLMAWNIYTVIDSAGKIKRIEEHVAEESKRMKEENDLMREEFNGLKRTVNKNDAEFTFSSIFQYAREMDSGNFKEYAIDGYIDALQIALKGGLAKDKVEVTVNCIKSIIDRNDYAENHLPLPLLSGKNTFYFDVLSNVKEKDDNIRFLCGYMLDRNRIRDVNGKKAPAGYVRIMSDYNPDSPSYKGKS